ncbi:hypothetical protein F0919_10510 [Taibaiella lutea]|uniref:Uncharacterized protein n=1 Tax=Taibaiella lutea TaxID=2608001 RepID=A0A5M6CIK2_9BACT|nr:hypothetical protein [Taibaiella lutea]KAA5535021.1 hypothetical protein F0919_10510 [Taibaiella lutea]
MPYNIEEQEDYLKNNSPYKMNDTEWRAMQERIKTNVLAASEKESKSRKVKFTSWKIAAAVAGLFFIGATCFTFWPAQKTIQSGNIAYDKAENPEKQLDAAINNLNESELNWVHQLNENEITEQNEYFEN